ncbi:MAG: hypothetical protein ACI8W8_004647 [Rhodothermales bacterium]|jgi:hypothetical protein
MLSLIERRDFLRARATGFPYRYETHKRSQMPVEYDPSLAAGVIYRRGYKLAGAYQIHARFTYHGQADVHREGDAEDWRMCQPGYGLMGIAIGSKSLFESYGKIRNASIIGWQDDGKFGVLVPAKPRSKKSKEPRPPKPVAAPTLKPGESIEVTVAVAPVAGGKSGITATLRGPDGSSIVVTHTVSRYRAEGYFGIAARGLTDFSVDEIQTQSEQAPLTVGEVDCHVCYPLGDTLTQKDGKWQVRFVGIFASDGKRAEIRVADSATPAGGWEAVTVAGAADIVSNRWRRNTL